MTKGSVNSPCMKIFGCGEPWPCWVKTSSGTIKGTIMCWCTHTEENNSRKGRLCKTPEQLRTPGAKKKTVGLSRAAPLKI